MVSQVLEPDADLDDLDLTGEVLDGQDGRRARVLECTFTGCSLDDVTLDDARFVDTAWEAVRAGTLSLASSTWQDGRWTGCRLGAVQAYGSRITRLEVRGGKIDYLNLRDAELVDVTLADVVVEELDLRTARVKRLVLDDCRVRRLDLTGATLTDVDLRGMTGLREIEGIDGLRGAHISSAQLLDLAPLLAAHLGVVVD